MAPKTVRRTFSYYPGCSAHATGKEYDASLRAVCHTLGISLQEIEGWICCGASSAHSLSHNLAIGLPAHNLALIEQSGLPAIAPCAACFHRLRYAQEEIAADPARYRWLRGALETQLQGSASVRSAISVFLEEIGLEKISSHVRLPLNRVPVVSYYGCLLARPPQTSALADPEHPDELDTLMQTLGASPQKWSYAVDCCGGALSIARPDLVQRMTQTLVDGARAAGAEIIITACPLCQINLEMRQIGAADMRMPAMYFTEAMGLAFGLAETSGWWKSHLIDPRPVLSSMNLW